MPASGTARLLRRRLLYLNPEGAWLALYQPDPAEHYGCTWSAQLTAPFKQLGNRVIGDGRAGFIQVSGFTILEFAFGATDVDLDHPLVTTSVINGDPRTNGPSALDADPGKVLYGNPKALHAGGTVQFGPNEIENSDSPGCMLQDDRASIQREDTHRFHLVYRSNTPGSIWVTLRRGEWSWKASTTRTDLTRRESAWKAPENVGAQPPPHQTRDAAVSHEPPTWIQRTDTIVSQGHSVVNV